MHKRRDEGQIKFWQVLIVIAIVGVLAFDLLAPQLAKVQLQDKAESTALEESKAFVSSPGSYSTKYYATCDRIRKAVTGYGAKILPSPDQVGLPPEEICPTIDEDGRISFKAEKKASCIVLCRVGLKNYYVVTVEVNEKFSL
ncbi:MAG: hypothetical protein DCC49_09120 [Acidobacteria bacterium]|nr:MAG: hypothetical protein DCC49_09120 [Acidobacteriota bacterium]